MKQSLARARVEIDLGALQRNGAALARRAGVPLLPMIKADAYGLGAEAVFRALESLEPWGYGVATVVEGEQLRDWGVSRPVLVFTPLLEQELARARSARLTPTLGFAEEIKAWRQRGRRRMASRDRHRHEPRRDSVAPGRGDKAPAAARPTRRGLHAFPFCRARRRNSCGSGEALSRGDRIAPLAPALAPRGQQRRNRAEGKKRLGSRASRDFPLRCR